MEGRLCISVIEAQNVLADTFAELSFYVRLRLGHAEVQTDTMSDCIAPKFLKDVRMDVQDTSSAVLRIELLQCGPRGDLVLGSDQLQVASITDKGTVVHWFQLKAPDDELAAELCMVLRYLPANGQRPMTPSYAMATREAKQRALDGPEPPAPTRAGSRPASNSGALQPSKAVFSDLQAELKQQAAFAPTTPPKVNAYPFTRPADSPAPLSTSSSAQILDAEDAPSRVASPSPRAPRARRLSMEQVKRVASAQLPWPVAVVSGMATGALIYLCKSRMGYSEDSDTVCAIGTCVHPSDQGRLKRREEAWQ